MKAVVLLVNEDGVLDAFHASALDPRIETRAVANCEQAEYALLRCQPAAVVIGGRSSKPLAAARRIKELSGAVPVILVVADSGEDQAIEALRLGASDYLRAPAAPPDVWASIARLCALAPRSSHAEAPCLVGRSAVVRDLRAYLAKVAASDCNVLVTGETGTGKELVAEVIHEYSRRGRRALVAVNCAAIPDTLLESELFGYERGAFTGASALRQGQFQAADGGTLFLDEIGEMTPLAQAKILRAIESKQIQRLGARVPVRVDVRVVAATNQDLELRVGTNEFRRDLYFRLNVARVHLPPLREHREDIPDLAHHFLEQQNQSSGHRALGFTDEAMDRLLEYRWPGNVRELRNLVEAAFVGNPYPRIGTADLPAWLTQRCDGGRDLSDRERLLEVLRTTRWNKSKAAEKLQWSRMTVYRKMARYGISDESPEAA